MRRMALRGLGLGIMLGGLAVPAQAADIAGLWSTGSQDGRVQIYRCGTAYCGRIVDAAPLRANPDQRDVHNADAALRTRRLKGLVVIAAFTGGPTEWKGGPVYDPESGDGAATGYLKLRADGTLELKGCVAIFCRTKVWTRVR